MKYLLRFGLTKKPADYESVKVEYEQEYDDEQTPREAGWNDLRAFVYRKVEEELSVHLEKQVKVVEETRKTIEAKAEKMPQIAGKALEYYYPTVEALPWQAFKEKRDAEPDEAAWIFADTPGAEDMAVMIQREGAIFVRMNQRRFLCKLSGNENQFINRIPQEKEGGK